MKLFSGGNTFIWLVIFWFRSLISGVVNRMDRKLGKTHSTNECVVRMKWWRSSHKLYKNSKCIRTYRFNVTVLLDKETLVRLLCEIWITHGGDYKEWSSGVWHRVVWYKYTTCTWYSILSFLPFFFLSFFLSFFLWPLLPTHCKCKPLLLHLITLTRHPHTR